MAMNKQDYMARGRAMFLEGKVPPDSWHSTLTWQERATLDGWREAQAQAQTEVQPKVKPGPLVELFRQTLDQCSRRSYTDAMRRADATIARLSGLRKFRTDMRGNV